jgi:transposase
VQAASAHVGLLLPRLRLVRSQRADCVKRINTLLNMLDPAQSPEGEPREHRDVDIILSLPGIGRVVTATMLAEAPQAVAERDYHALRSLSGVAPVTRKSGKRRVVIMRHACNNRLRNAFYHAARVSSQADPHSHAVYSELRRRGQSHGRALRAVADRMLRILVAMLESGTLYDAARPRRVPAGAVPTEKAA